MRRSKCISIYLANKHPPSHPTHTSLSLRSLSVAIRTDLSINLYLDGIYFDPPPPPPPHTHTHCTPHRVLTSLSPKVSMRISRIDLKCSSHCSTLMALFLTHFNNVSNMWRRSLTLKPPQTTVSHAMHTSKPCLTCDTCTNIKTCILLCITQRHLLGSSNKIQKVIWHAQVDRRSAHRRESTLLSNKGIISPCFSPLSWSGNFYYEPILTHFSQYLGARTQLCLLDLRYSHMYPCCIYVSRVKEQNYSKL